MRKKFILALAALAMTSLLYADPSVRARMQELGMQEADIQTLLSGDTLASVTGDSQLDYFVPNSYLASRLAEVVNSLQPKYSVEALYYVPFGQAEDRTAFFNALLNIASMAGLDQKSGYKTTELIHSSMSIDKIGGKPVPAPTVADRPSSFTFFARQQDALYGNIEYQVDYLAQGDEVAVTFTNAARIRRALFTYADANGQKLFLHYIPLPQGYLVYTVLINKQNPAQLSPSKTNADIFSRLEAFKNWFVSRISN